MTTDYDILAEKVAEYIGVVQPQLDKLDSMRKEAAKAASDKVRFVKRATEAVGALAYAGLVDRGDVNNLIEKVSEDPSLTWDIVEKVARAVEPQSLGHRSQEQASTSRDQDPWLREFGGYNNGATGVID
jgi:hypothetical protein